MIDFDNIKPSKKPEIPEGFFKDLPSKVLSEIPKENKGASWTTWASFSAIAATLLLFLWIGGTTSEKMDSVDSRVNTIAELKVTQEAEKNTDVIDFVYDELASVDLDVSSGSTILVLESIEIEDDIDDIELSDFVAVLDDNDLDIDWYDGI